MMLGDIKFRGYINSSETLAGQASPRPPIPEGGTACACCRPGCGRSHGPWTDSLPCTERTKDPSTVKIGILTSGGDCPGLNAVIRGAVLKGIKSHGHEFT